MSDMNCITSSTPDKNKKTRRKPQPAIRRDDGSYAINLTKGYHAVVDAEDADLACYLWCAYRSTGRSSVYVVRRITVSKNKSRFEYLHRVILSRKLGRPLNEDEYVDHIDVDSLNCRRSNLRLATVAENNRNRGKRRGKNPYKGAFYNKIARRWFSKIGANKQVIHLGYFDTPEEAHAAYCEAANKLHGEFARME